MKRKWLWIPAGILLVLILLGGASWLIFQKPPYEPGMVSQENSLAAPLDPPPQTASSFWQVEEDIELYHFASGQGRNVLVIHGGPGYPYSQPLAVFSALEERYQFHYYDQRGSGRSTRPIDSFSSQNYYQNTRTLERRLGLSAQIADIERIRRILGDDQLILVGHSFGGFLASLYAAEFPEHVAGLVLAAPADVLVMPTDREDLFAAVESELPGERRAEYQQFLEEYWNFKEIFEKTDADLAALQEEFGRFYQQTEAIESGPVQGEPGGWMVWGMYFSMGQRHDYRPALSRVTAPVLVLHGQDDLQSVQVAQMYQDAFPNAELVEIANAGHSIFSDQPEKFLKVYTEFVTALP